MVMVLLGSIEIFSARATKIDRYVKEPAFCRHRAALDRELGTFDREQNEALALFRVPRELRNAVSVEVTRSALRLEFAALGSRAALPESLCRCRR